MTTDAQEKGRSGGWRARWRLLGWLAAAAAAAAAGWWARDAVPGADGPPLMRVSEMGHLAALRVHYANVIEFTEKRSPDIPWTDWELRLGGSRVLLVARGDCLLGTDLRQARYEQVDTAARTVVLRLARPAVMSARVIHGPREQGGSYFLLADDYGLERLVPGTAARTRAIDAALARAQQDVARACGDEGYLQAARQNAESVLGSSLRALGWQARFVWP